MTDTPHTHTHIQTRRSQVSLFANFGNALKNGRYNNNNPWTKLQQTTVIMEHKNLHRISKQFTALYYNSDIPAIFLYVNQRSLLQFNCWSDAPRRSGPTWRFRTK